MDKKNKTQIKSQAGKQTHQQTEIRRNRTKHHGGELEDWKM